MIPGDLFVALYFSVFPRFSTGSTYSFCNSLLYTHPKSWSLLSLARLSWSHVSSLPLANLTRLTSSAVFLQKRKGLPVRSPDNANLMKGLIFQ